MKSLGTPVKAGSALLLKPCIQRRVDSASKLAATPGVPLSTPSSSSSPCCFTCPLQHPSFTCPLQHPSFTCPLQHPSFTCPLQHPSFTCPLQHPLQDYGDIRVQRGRGQTAATPLSDKVPVHLGQGQPGACHKLRPLSRRCQCHTPAQPCQEDSPQAWQCCQDNQVHLGLLLHSVAQETPLPPRPWSHPRGLQLGVEPGSQNMPPLMPPNIRRGRGWGPAGPSQAHSSRYRWKATAQNPAGVARGGSVYRWTSEKENGSTGPSGPGP
ncbi:hypothetical protein SKAU_G00075950, partial [Synaphobranchus kaupii]